MKQLTLHKHRLYDIDCIEVIEKLYSLYKQVVATVPRQPQPIEIEKQTTDKVEKVSFNWRKLIARIYEADPLINKIYKNSNTLKIV
jgi:hypothetical protein